MRILRKINPFENIFEIKYYLAHETTMKFFQFPLFLFFEQLPSTLSVKR